MSGRAQIRNQATDLRKFGLDHPAPCLLSCGIQFPCCSSGWCSNGGKLQAVPDSLMSSSD